MINHKIGFTLATGVFWVKNSVFMPSHNFTLFMFIIIPQFSLIVYSQSIEWLCQFISFLFCANIIYRLYAFYMCIMRVHSIFLSNFFITLLESYIIHIFCKKSWTVYQRIIKQRVAYIDCTSKSICYWII